jgi:hypothetical protein
MSMHGMRRTLIARASHPIPKNHRENFLAEGESWNANDPTLTSLFDVPRTLQRENIVRACRRPSRWGSLYAGRRVREHAAGRVREYALLPGEGEWRDVAS